MLLGRRPSKPPAGRASSPPTLSSGSKLRGIELRQRRSLAIQTIEASLPPAERSEQLELERGPPWRSEAVTFALDHTPEGDPQRQYMRPRCIPRREKGRRGGIRDLGMLNPIMNLKVVDKIRRRIHKPRRFCAFPGTDTPFFFSLDTRIMSRTASCPGLSCLKSACVPVWRQ